MSRCVLLILLVLLSSVARLAHAATDLSYGADPRQTMAVYLPPHPRDAPIIVMVHGGAWMFGDKDNPGLAEPKAGHWSASGAIFVAINYRMLPQAGPLAQAQDVAVALAYVQRHAREWHGDPSRIVLMGHSAGAHLVSLLAVAPSLTRAAGVQPWLATVSLDSGAVDVPGIMNNPHARFYDRVFGNDPVAWATVSPYDRMAAAPAAPMFMVCSSERRESCPANERFVAKARQLGGKADVLPVPLSHMDINRTLGAQNTYTDQIDAWLKKNAGI
ncbi:alpha/beta hydrolase fold domain-containing protein [Luteibacter aegosomatissinici]|uniref:alpha/beta hydrolase fold domain-containing protein n=1 Tax=Luteibacter aegosomatissinici TaxID=2911539 RepID=UPI001FF856A8|nr:alpha/beta hydrolase [Luteibacter aegosomatissinici]UPG94620.1 alpha/beta hydrolase [Luteibacter aegosomatissinici]